MNYWKLILFTVSSVNTLKRTSEAVLKKTSNVLECGKSVPEQTLQQWPQTDAVGGQRSTLYTNFFFSIYRYIKENQRIENSEKKEKEENSF